MPRYSLRLLVVAAILAAMPAFADTTISSRTGAVNALGQPVSATAEFTIHPDGVVVRLTNTSSDFSSVHQTLRGVSFTVLNHTAKGELGFTRGHSKTISGSSVLTSADEGETRWSLATSGNVYTLQAPGTMRTILPEADVSGADKSVTDTPANNPFLSGACTFQILTPEIDLTSDIVGVKFLWSDDIAPPQPAISKGTTEKEGENPSQRTRTTSSDPLPYTSGGDGNVMVNAAPGASNNYGGDPSGGGGGGSSSPAVGASTQPTTQPVNLLPIFEPPTGRGPNLPPPTDVTPIITPPSGQGPNLPLAANPGVVEAPAPIPEPTTLGILAVGTGLVATSVWAKRKR